MCRSHLHRLSRFGLVALLAWLAAGCGRDPASPLRVGINAWPGYEFIYLAQEMGFYKAEGVDVRVIEFSSLSDARRAYERGQIDAFGTTVIEVLQARDHSLRSPQIVQVVDSSEGADVILARPGITNGAALRGRRIGVELASLGVYILVRGLEKSGLSLADVTAVSMDQLAMEAAFRSGELDAVVTYPPVAMRLVREAGAVAVFTTAEIPGEVIDVLAVEQALVEQRPEDVGKLLRGFHRAVAYAREHPAEAHAIMAARQGITAQEFAGTLNNGLRIFTEADQDVFFGPGGRLAEVVRIVDRVLRASGQITGPDRRGEIATRRFAGTTGQP